MVTQSRKEEVDREVKVLKFPEGDNLYELVVKRLGQVEAEKRISPKSLNINLSDYEWRKLKEQLLEDDLIEIKGTNTYKKIDISQSNEVRA